MSPGKIAGKTALITGGTSGIGLGIAEKFGDEGASLLINGTGHVKGNDALKKLHQKGFEAEYHAGDIRDPEINKALVNQAVEKYKNLDILVMSAGSLGIGKLTELTIDEWNKTINTNLNAIFYLLKYGIPAIQKSGGGSIIIIGSTAAFHAFPNHPAYTASKGALVPLVKQVAVDYGPEIRINIICPGQVDTPLLRSSVKAFENPETIIRKTEERLPLKRLGTPQDIANAALYLASEESSWVTGSCFTIDGGFLCAN